MFLEYCTVRMGELARIGEVSWHDHRAIRIPRNDRTEVGAHQRRSHIHIRLNYISGEEHTTAVQGTKKGHIGFFSFIFFIYFFYSLLRIYFCLLIIFWLLFLFIFIYFLCSAPPPSFGFDTRLDFYRARGRRKCSASVVCSAQVSVNTLVAKWRKKHLGMYTTVSHAW